MNFKEKELYLLDEKENELKLFSQSLLQVFLGEKENTENFILCESSKS